MLFLKLVIVSIVLAAVSLSSHAATVSLSVGGEVTELEVTHCRTDAHKSGQLQVAAELTAIGTFRGRQATLLLWKVVNANAENIDLHLIELAPELRTASTLAASGQIAMDYTSELGRRQREANELFDPEALEGLESEEMLVKMNAMMEAQAKGLDAVDDEMDAEFAHTRSFGAITISGSTIEFEGSDTRVIRGDKVDAFASIAGAPMHVTAECED